MSISHHTSQRIDLDVVWKKQDISASLQDAIRTTSAMVHRVITNPPNARNITEWCKRKECWDAICSEEILLSDSFSRELLDLSHGGSTRKDKGIDGPDAGDLELIAAISAIPDKV